MWKKKNALLDSEFFAGGFVGGVTVNSYETFPFEVPTFPKDFLEIQSIWRKSPWKRTGPDYFIEKRHETFLWIDEAFRSKLMHW